MNRNRPPETAKPILEMKRTAQTRRQFIASSVEGNPEQRLSFEDVKVRCGSVSDEALYNDAHILQQEGKPVVAHKHFFEFSTDELKTIGRRTRERKSQKDSIGRAALQLMAPGVNEARSIRFPREFADLQLRLTELWDKAHRLFILDAGSTTAAIARQLAMVKTPNPERHVAHIRVLTNSDLVQQILTSGLSDHGLILLGGGSGATRVQLPELWPALPGGVGFAR